MGETREERIAEFLEENDCAVLALYVINGLHEFLNDDLEGTAAAAAFGVAIDDVRRPRAKQDLRMFTADIDEVTCPRIAVLGTDGAIGKRTTLRSRSRQQ